MSKILVTGPILLSMLFPLSSLAAAVAAQASGLKAVVPDEYIVVLHTPAVLKQDLQQQARWTEQQVDSLVNQTGVQALRLYQHSINGALIKADARQLAELKKSANVAYIEPNRYVSIEPAVSALQQNATWGLDRIDQRALPLNQQYNPTQTGQNVTAFVIDTGVMNNHSEFSGRASNGYDFVDNDAVAQDCHGHGTHVAGTIAGTVYGVAKQANIVGVRVLDCAGSGTIAGVVAGVNWVAAQQPGQTKIGNMSLGGGVSQALDDAVNAAVDRGVFMAVAAGNNGADACGFSPARAVKAFTVGSTTASDQRSGFSNFGSCLDIFAPGSNISSAWNNGGLNTISGTSMAAPHVAGVAALFLQQQAGQNPQQLAQTILTSATANVLSDIKAGSPNKLVYTEGAAAEPPPALKVTLSGAGSSSHYYNLTVPAGKTRLTIKTSGGQGDVDLYTMFNDRPDPFINNCAAETENSNEEQCVFQAPAAGNWQILVYGYSAFSNVTLTASYQ